ALMACRVLFVLTVYSVRLSSMCRAYVSSWLRLCIVMVAPICRHGSVAIALACAPMAAVYRVRILWRAVWRVTSVWIACDLRVVSVWLSPMERGYGVLVAWLWRAVGVCLAYGCGCRVACG